MARGFAEVGVQVMTQGGDSYHPSQRHKNKKKSLKSN